MEERPLISQQAQRELQRTALLLFGFIATIWLVELVDWFVFDGRLDLLGIVPREARGLRGIFLAPFLHGGVPHLLANTVPLLVLGAILMIRHRRIVVSVVLVIMVVGGLGTWLTGPTNSLHIGSSVLIFGFIGFLLASAYRERSAAAIILAILVLILYGSVLWGILPQGNGISWQSHLFGFVGGIVAARYLVKARKPLPSVET